MSSYGAYNVKLVLKTSIHYIITSITRFVLHNIGQLRPFNIDLSIYSTLGYRNHNETSKFVNHYGAKKKKTKQNKKIENQKLGGKCRTSKYIHSYQKDYHNFFLELEPFNLGDGLEDSLNAEGHRSLTLENCQKRIFVKRLNTFGINF